MAEMIDLQENMSGYMTGAIKGFCRQSWCQMVTRRAYFVRHHLRVIKPIILGSVILGIVGAAFGGFKIGEFANFQDPTFRKFHGIDASKVSRVFDKERQVFVSKYITRKDTNINSFSSVLINCVTESNNKISDISTTQIIQPKTSDGIEAAVNFVLGILEKMSFIRM